MSELCAIMMEQLVDATDEHNLFGIFDYQILIIMSNVFRTALALIGRLV